MSVERKPKWAWSDVDDPDPYYPKCDRCDAFARWSVGNFETDKQLMMSALIIRWMACGTHLSRVLDDAVWHLDAVMVYDLTYPPERP